MDKELDESKKPSLLRKQLVKLSKSQLPGQPPFFRGTIPFRTTLSIEELADRAIEHHCAYSHGILIACFSTMIEEVYDALADGFNVDFGLWRTDMTVLGRFNTEYDKFDRKRHALRINLLPSPRLNQLAGCFPVEVSRFNANVPLPNEVSIHNNTYRGQEDREFCVIPAGYALPLFIHGRRLKIMGDHPEVGIVFRQEEGGDKRYFIEPQMVFINESTRLAFMLPEPLAPGVWMVEVHTQFSPNYILYKEPRVGYVSLTVSDATLPG